MFSCSSCGVKLAFCFLCILVLMLLAACFEIYFHFLNIVPGYPALLIFINNFSAEFPGV